MLLMERLLLPVVVVVVVVVVVGGGSRVLVLYCYRYCVLIKMRVIIALSLQILNSRHHEVVGNKHTSI